MNALLDLIRSILKADVPEDIKSNLAENLMQCITLLQPALVHFCLDVLALHCGIRSEAITVESFTLLSEQNLAELGFKIGHRALIMNSRSRSGPAVPVSSPLPEPMTPSSSPSHSSHSPSSSSSVMNHDYDVTQILKNSRPGTKVSGEALVSKLQEGVYYDRHERLWMVKVLARHLMENCQRINYPTREEKINMVSALVSTFPILKDAKLPHGYEAFYDPVSRTGHLEFYIRERRSRSAHIQTLWTHAKKSAVVVPNDEGVEEIERVLRERRPNSQNKDELLKLMADTRSVRFHWIATAKPDVTTVLKKYPRFVDMNAALEEDFAALQPDAQDLKTCWAMYRDKVLMKAGKLASSDSELHELMQLIVDDLNEDKKTEISLLTLPFLLVPTARRGVKKARLSRKKAVDMFFQDLPGVTVNEAVQQLTANEIHQPVLFRIDDQYFVKLDNTAVCIYEPSCFADCVDFLLHTFFVFNVQYPQELKLVYHLFELILSIKPSLSSSIVNDFLRSVS